MAMAGGRPEYMPVAEAVCKTIIEKQNTLMTSSGGAYQGICVNGPIAKADPSELPLQPLWPKSQSPRGWRDRPMYFPGAHECRRPCRRSGDALPNMARCVSPAFALPKTKTAFPKAGPHSPRINTNAPAGRIPPRSLSLSLAASGPLSTVDRARAQFRDGNAGEFFRAANVMKSVWTSNSQPLAWYARDHVLQFDDLRQYGAHRLDQGQDQDTPG